ncbi:hypothetical protein [Oryzomonas rubra]|uniref:hypothetical protein n=1 Tax=Oryzomonas rubra TaxID=2509454 RepID=UPI00165D9CEE|nr:hypothetical protein [Oryzomonas rubra]
MHLYTECPGCGKPVTANLTHKEAWCGTDEMRPAAVVMCPECRTEIEILVVTRRKT